MVGINTISCPVCGSLVLQREFLNDAQYTGHVCQTCSTAFGWPLPTQRFLDDWYSRPTTLKSCEDLSQGPNLRPAGWKLKEISRCGEELAAAGAEGFHLDIGCHIGIFVEHMSSRGFTSVGIDPNPVAVAFARETRGLEVHLGSIDSFLPKAPDFDVITLWDVIEHLADPVASLHKLRSLLKPNGLLGIGTPNGTSLIRQATNISRKLRGQPLMTMLDPPRHLFVFNRRALTTMLFKTGFRAIRTWTLDTYEVRLEQGALYTSPPMYRLAYWTLYQLGRFVDRGDRLFVVARKA